MSWASRRRTIYFIFFASLFALIAVSFYYFVIYEAPTCFDGVRNQDEQDVDCGGVCAKVCDFQAIDPIILWSKAFKVKDGIYNVFTLIENPNLETESFGVPYSFKLYDADNILIAERTGKVDLPPRGLVPVFERTVITNERIPFRSPTFQFTDSINWVRTSEERANLSVQNKVLSEKDGNTRLDVSIKNETVRTVKDIEVTAIITNSEGNAIAVSQTVIDSLVKKTTEEVSFTWPGLFSEESNQIEIIVLDK